MIALARAVWWNPGRHTIGYGGIIFIIVSKVTATYLPSRKLSKLDQQDKQDTAGEAGTSS